LSSARSGSTWLAGLLAAPFRYRLLFEPFHPENVPGAELIADHFYSPGSVSEEVLDFLKRSLNDQINSRWIAQSSNRKFGMHRWRWWPKVRIVKCIRGNLLIPLLRDTFGDDLSIIVLLRHPGAVVESMKRVKFPWAYDLSTLFAQEEFAKIYDLDFNCLKQQAQNPISKITIRWVIENKYLFKNSDDLKIRLLFYEDMISDPETQISTLCADLNIKMMENITEKINTPSYTTHPRSPVIKGDFSPGFWRNSLPQSEIDQIEAILNSVNFTYPR
jgi:hypothetical protein